MADTDPPKPVSPRQKQLNMRIGKFALAVFVAGTLIYMGCDSIWYWNTNSEPTEVRLADLKYPWPFFESRNVKITGAYMLNDCVVESMGEAKIPIMYFYPLVPADAEGVEELKSLEARKELEADPESEGRRQKLIFHLSRECRALYRVKAKESASAHSGSDGPFLVGSLSNSAPSRTVAIFRKSCPNFPEKGIFTVYAGNQITVFEALVSLAIAAACGFLALRLWKNVRTVPGIEQQEIDETRSAMIFVLGFIGFVFAIMFLIAGCQTI